MRQLVAAIYPAKHRFTFCFPTCFLPWPFPLWLHWLHGLLNLQYSVSLYPDRHSFRCHLFWPVLCWWLTGMDKHGSRVSIYPLLMWCRLSKLMKFHDRRATTSFLVLFIFLASSSESREIFHLHLKMPRRLSAIRLLIKLANCVNAGPHLIIIRHEKWKVVRQASLSCLFPSSPFLPL